MVVANSTWVRPAQALIYSDSGEVQYFPPRNRGRLPRALTFGDHQDYRHHAADQHSVHAGEEPSQLISYQFPEQLQEEDSFLITSGSESFHMEVPPYEYDSFESEYLKNSIIEQDLHSFSYMDLEAPSMSTPNEQYIHNVMRRKKLSPKSPLISKQQPYLSSMSDTQNGCFSPLLQSDPNQCLPLADLVEMYSKKLEAAESARFAKEECTSASSESEGPTDKNEEGDGEQDVSNLNAMDGICDQRSQHDVREHEKDFDCNSREKNAINSRNALQLMAFDIQLFLQKLDDMSTEEDSLSRLVTRLDGRARVHSPELLQRNRTICDDGMIRPLTYPTVSFILNRFLSQV